jgi:hypothetical protein
MGEAEWLAAEEPGPMLRHLTHEVHQAPDAIGDHPRAVQPSPRKLRLFACACCRAVWPLLTAPCGRRAVEVAERFADGLAAEGERAAAVPDDLAGEPATARRYAGLLARDCLGPFRPGGVWHPPGGRDFPLPAAAQAALLRDVFGNPFRPVELRHLGNALCRRCHGAGTRPDVYPPKPCPACSCITPAALAVGRRAYDERDFAALPVLADVLEEAGCEDGPLLWHLRGQDLCPCLGVPCCAFAGDPDPRWREAHTCARCRGTGRVPLAGPHALGCWALDLVLGKS